MDKVSFIRMEDGTPSEYEFLEELEKEYVSGLADRVLENLNTLKTSMGGYQVSRYEHSLQSASRAHRDGQDEEIVVAALLHDIGDDLAPYNHGELAASILKPYVSERTYWIVKHHGLFQAYYYAHHFGGDRNVRDLYKDSPYFQDCVSFCHKYDQNCFDPAYDTLPIEFFEPMLRRVFSRKPFMHDRSAVA